MAVPLTGPKHLQLSTSVNLLCLTLPNMVFLRVFNATELYQTVLYQTVLYQTAPCQTLLAKLYCARMYSPPAVPRFLPNC